jgi:hypothetical protein
VFVEEDLVVAQAVERPLSACSQVAHDIVHGTVRSSHQSLPSSNGTTKEKLADLATACTHPG